MLDAFKKVKKVRDMAIGEEGYLQLGAVFLDENDQEWLNLSGLVGSKYSGVLSLPVRRVSADPHGFDIELSPFFQTPHYGLSHHFRYHPDMVRIDELNTVVVPEVRTVQAVPSIPLKTVLSPLYSIFLAPDTMNRVLIRAGIPEVLHGENPIFNGVILHGPAGTGKTALQRALAQVYRNAGAHAVELHAASLSDKYIASFAHNLDEKISEVVEKTRKDGRPAFIFLDEATSLVMSADLRNESGADYYQEAVDVLKKYISNYPELVFSITTNAAPDRYDDALVRDGRLASIEIPLPGPEEKKQIWAHYIRENDVLPPLSDDQLTELVALTPQEQGAFIHEFCRGYLAAAKLELEMAESRGKTLLDALASGVHLTLEAVRKRINFEVFCQDVQKAVAGKRKPDLKRAIGFGA